MSCCAGLNLAVRRTGSPGLVLPSWFAPLVANASPAAKSLLGIQTQAKPTSVATPVTSSASSSSSTTTNTSGPQASSSNSQGTGSADQAAGLNTGAGTQASPDANYMTDGACSTQGESRADGYICTSFGGGLKWAKRRDTTPVTFHDQDDVPGLQLPSTGKSTAKAAGISLGVLVLGAGALWFFNRKKKRTRRRR